MKNEKFLPLGTVVLLNGGTHRVMIVGYSFVDPEIDARKMFDYIGAFYPEGIFSLEKIMAFNHSDIKEISFIGCNDADYVKFNTQMLKVNEKYVDENNNLKTHPTQVILNETMKSNKEGK